MPINFNSKGRAKKQTATIKKKISAQQWEVETISGRRASVAGSGNYPVGSTVAILSGTILHRVEETLKRNIKII